MFSWPGCSVWGWADPAPQCRSRAGLPGPAEAAFSPSQYYEMSYGLNIEMHKQVSLGGPGALSQLPCPRSPSPVGMATSGPFRVFPSHGERGKSPRAVARGRLCWWGACFLL